MHDKDFGRLRVLDVTKPVHELVLIRMRRETVERLDLRPHDNLLAEHSHALDTIEQTTAQASPKTSETSCSIPSSASTKAAPNRLAASA